MLDSELLAEVYLELLGGAEPSMELSANSQKKVVNTDVKIERNYIPSRNFSITDEDCKAHEEFLNTKIKDALWLK